ncbi:MAG: hypothetical protein V1914_00400 [archaeon]
MKRGIIILATLLLLTPLCSATLQEHMDQVQTYATQYDNGELDAAKLVVYIEYTKNKMYEELEQKGQKAFTESEIETIFTKSPQDDQNQDWSNRYEKKFLTKDFTILFNAQHFYRSDREYYEKREYEAQAYYQIDYEIAPLKGIAITTDLETELAKFIEDLKAVSFEEKPTIEEWEALQERFSELKMQVNKMQNKEKCEEFMEKVLDRAENEERIFETVYRAKLKETIKQECWDDQKCEEKCDTQQNCWQDCQPKEICEDLCNQVNCREEEVCEENCTLDPSTNETLCTTGVCQTEQVCDEECSKQNCRWDQECSEVCKDRPNCHQDCQPSQRCENRTDGEAQIEGRCGKDYQDIRINSWGQGLEYYNELNNFQHGDRWCEEDLTSLVAIRKALQPSINNEFAIWYFEEFLKSDPEKIVNGDQGFKKLLALLIKNEEKISETLYCSETPTWPEGFEKIEITYNKNNARVEVWEKFIPIEWQNAKYWTTLYEYSWIPDQELMKDLILYEIEEHGTFGPSADEIAAIKADEGKMELVQRIADKYGGSLDIKLELNEKDIPVILKYLQINPDVVFTLSDQINENPDISVTIDYDSLYNFINYMTFQMEGRDIQGPHWVHTDQGGPGKFFSALGAISKFWREGVTIKPRYSLLKIIFNSKTLISIMGESEVTSSPVPVQYQKETMAIETTGKVIFDKDE